MIAKVKFTNAKLAYSSGEKDRAFILFSEIESKSADANYYLGLF